MFEQFINRNFSPASQQVIDAANGIIREYQQAGFTLTLRQLYYQFVSRDMLANKQSEYKRLGSIINDGRLAGEIDWDAIEDRTRHLREYSTFDSPADAARETAKQYLENLWDAQPTYAEVWIEKDALLGVIEPVCGRWRLPHFACRGYASQSELYVAGKRLAERVDRGQSVVIFHLGDHDPSGIDMTRDNRDRLHLFAAGQPYEGDELDEAYTEQIEVVRLALNMDQVRQYNPPPNPAKDTDGRAAGYKDLYGSSSWELDALDPKVIDKIIDGAVRSIVDPDRWDDSVAAEKANRRKLLDAADAMENDDVA
jgi:hypothetical protein